MRAVEVGRRYLLHGAICLPWPMLITHSVTSISPFVIAACVWACIVQAADNSDSSSRSSWSVCHRGHFQKTLCSSISDQVPRAPTNTETALRQALVRKLEVRDVRWDLVWAFGDILADVPQRVGNNRALDAASNAILRTMGSLNGSAYTSRMTKEYAQALRALRITLRDPQNAETAETWLAVYLMWICHVRAPRALSAKCASLTSAKGLVRPARRLGPEPFARSAASLGFDASEEFQRDG